MIFELLCVKGGVKTSLLRKVICDDSPAKAELNKPRPYFPDTMPGLDPTIAQKSSKFGDEFFVITVLTPRNVECIDQINQARTKS